MRITRIKDSNHNKQEAKNAKTHKNNEYPKILRSQGATITTPQVTANDRPLTNYLVLHSGPPMLKIPMPENTSYSFIPNTNIP